MRMNCQKAQAIFNTQTAPSLRVAFQKKYRMGRENLPLKTRPFMKVSGLMVSKVAKASSQLQLETLMKVNGQTIK